MAPTEFAFKNVQNKFGRPCATQERLHRGLFSDDRGA
jgi:hypothetical protein